MKRVLTALACALTLLMPLDGAAHASTSPTGTPMSASSTTGPYEFINYNSGKVRQRTRGVDRQQCLRRSNSVRLVHIR